MDEGGRISQLVQSFFEPSYRGIAIDVGAYHNTWLSNTWKLESEGWQVYCLEPNERADLSQRRNVFTYAISNYISDEAPFYIYQAGYGPDGMAGYSGLIEHNLSETGIDPQVRTVSVRTMDWFLEKMCVVEKTIDFVSIDVEGSEMKVLEGFNLQRWQPKIICIENIDQEDWGIRHHIVREGYKFFKRLIYNDIYILEYQLPRNGKELTELTMTYNKCYESGDWFDEMQHMNTMQAMMRRVPHRFEHPLRAWEYGLALNALRQVSHREVLDVGGGGSLFAPAAIWPDIGVESVLQIDPGDIGGWIEAQYEVLIKKISDIKENALAFLQKDFMEFESRKLYDTVACLSVIEHIPNDKEFFEKLLTFVKKNGLLILTTDFHPSGKAQLDGHLRTYNEKSMKALVALGTKAGFKPFDKPDWSYQGVHVNFYNFAAMVLKRMK